MLQHNWLIGAWLFAVGAAVGSFLNVVVYRLPRGLSLVWPGSHCPACGRPIRWFDNVPILSWLVLRGRCRDCRGPISPRYPAVETLTAALFLALGLAEVLWGGINLPHDQWSSDSPRPAAELCGLYAYHLTLLTTLLGAALIELGAERPPLRLFFPALAVGLVAPLIWPMLHPVHAGGEAGRLSGLIDSAAGLVAAGVWVFLAPHLWKEKSLLAAVLCVGLYLGWQAAVVLVPATLVLDALGTAVGRVLAGTASRRKLGSAAGPVHGQDARATGRVPASVWLVLMTTAWILAWAWIWGSR